MSEQSPALDGYGREPIAEDVLGAAVVYICQDSHAVVVSEFDAAWISWPPGREDVLLLQMARDVVLREAGRILDMRLQDAAAEGRA